MSERINWTSRLGFILASAGAAVGLGAIWKFPYLAGSNGGSAFLFPYVILSFTIGLVLLLAEIALGRLGKGGIVTAYRAIGGKKWAVFGYLGILTGFCVLCFYSVIGGWTISYLVDALLGNSIVADKSALEAHFGALVANPMVSIGFQAAFLMFTAWVVVFDVAKGIERLSKILMPLLLVLVLIVIIQLPVACCKDDLVVFEYRMELQLLGQRFCAGNTIQHPERVLQFVSQFRR